MIPDQSLAAIVLAGGRGRRIGGDAGDHTLLRFSLPVIADAVSGGLGPLAGLLGAMDWLTVNAPECRWLLSVPVDVPFLPGDLTARLAASAESEEVIACASSAGTVHPIIALTPLRLRADLATEKPRRR